MRIEVERQLVAARPQDLRDRQLRQFRHRARAGRRVDRHGEGAGRALLLGRDALHDVQLPAHEAGRRAGAARPRPAHLRSAEEAHRHLATSVPGRAPAPAAAGKRGATARQPATTPRSSSRSRGRRRGGRRDRGASSSSRAAFEQLRRRVSAFLRVERVVGFGGEPGDEQDFLERFRRPAPAVRLVQFQRLEKFSGQRHRLEDRPPERGVPEPTSSANP